MSASPRGYVVICWVDALSREEAMETIRSAFPDGERVVPVKTGQNFPQGMVPDSKRALVAARIQAQREEQASRRVTLRLDTLVTRSEVE